MAENPIQNCQVRFQFKCPKQWDALQETGEAGVRLCGQCHKQVYLCQSTQEAAQHARAGHCVAVPVGLASPRTPQDEREQVEALAHPHGVLSSQLHGHEIDQDVFRLVPREVSRRYGLFPLRRVGGSLLVAMSDPTHIEAIDDLKFLTGYNVEVLVASQQEIQAALDRAELENPGDVEMGVMICEEAPEPDLFEGLVGKLIRKVLLDAHQKNEAQVQIENTGSGMVIRYGLAGSRRDAMWFPFTLRHELLRQLRRASSTIAEQEGQLHIQTRDQRISYQVRFNPTALGEEVLLQPL